MPLQIFWLSVKLSTGIKGFKTSVLKPFLWAYLLTRGLFVCKEVRVYFFQLIGGCN